MCHIQAGYIVVAWICRKNIVVFHVCVYVHVHVYVYVYSLIASYGVGTAAGTGDRFIYKNIQPLLS